MLHLVGFLLTLTRRNLPTRTEREEEEEGEKKMAPFL